MMKLNYVATLLMIFIKCLMCVHGIKCYQCRSDVEERCAELRNDEYLSECILRQTRRQLEIPKLQSRTKTSKSVPYCRKISQALYFTTEYVYTTIRECAYTHENLENCYKSPWRDSKVVTCDCATEGCNQGYSKHRKKSFLIVFLCTIFSSVSWRFFLRNNQMLLLT